MIPPPTVNCLIHTPPSVTVMNTRLHTYRKTVSNQTSLITGQKITKDKIIVGNKYLNNHDTSQGRKLKPAQPNLIKHARSKQ